MKINSSRGFDNDLSIGTSGENYAIIFYMKKYNLEPSIINKCTDKRYDWEVFLNNKFIRFENKHDIASYSTGNIAIEFRCKKIPSGILTSIADYYIIIFYKGMLRINKNLLKTYIEDNWDKLPKHYSGGDGGRADNILMPINIIVSLGVFLETYTLEQYYNLHIAPFTHYKGGTMTYIDNVVKDISFV